MPGAVRLPEGVKIQIPLNMGPIPANETEFARVELFLHPAVSSEPLSLNDVTIDPSPDSPPKTPPRRNPGRVNPR
jgi:hypothetical protein